MVKMKTQRNLDIDLSKVRYNDKNIFHVIAHSQGGIPYLIKHVTQEYGKEYVQELLHEKNNDEETPLITFVKKNLWVITEEDFAQAFKALATAGADLDETDKDGNSIVCFLGKKKPKLLVPLIEMGFLHEQLLETLSVWEKDGWDRKYLIAITKLFSADQLAKIGFSRIKYYLWRHCPECILLWRDLVPLGYWLRDFFKTEDWPEGIEAEDDDMQEQGNEV